MPAKFADRIFTCFLRSLDFGWRSLHLPRRVQDLEAYTAEVESSPPRAHKAGVETSPRLTQKAEEEACFKIATNQGYVQFI